MKIILLIALTLLAACNEKKEPLVEVVKTVAEIGGCDDDALCGVKMTDGTHTRAAHPTVGQKMYGVMVGQFTEHYVIKSYWIEYYVKRH